MAMGGPSLRVQGERVILWNGSFGVRAIPARAGRTQQQESQGTVKVGHPCACRENAPRIPSLTFRNGPSLRVQGERNPPARDGTDDGAIPARAGRTYTGTLRKMESKGHPCACRENYQRSRSHMRPVGPSLRVQGERTTTGLSITAPRAIPACAGRT